MSEIIRLAITCSVPISIMGMAAFLIYKQVDGWGWYLFCAFGIAHAYIGVIEDCAREVIKNDRSN